MKKFYRSKKDKIISGVCGGLSVYLGVDASIIRLICVLLGFTGTGLVVYIVACFIDPLEPDEIDSDGEYVN